MMMKFSDLEELRQVFEYDPETGNFYWLIDTYGFGGRIERGSIAGSRDKNSRVHIGYKGKMQRAHVLAYWFMKNEPVPEGFEIDHHDRNDNNNKWENLKLSTRAMNIYNAPPRIDNTTGHRGVYCQRRKRVCWYARIYIDKKIISLGTFSTFEEAVEARRAAEMKYFGRIFNEDKVLG